MKAHPLPSKHQNVTVTFEYPSWVQGTNLLSTALTSKQFIVLFQKMTIDIIAIVNGNVLLLVSGLPSLAWVTALPSSSSLPPFLLSS